MTDETVKADNSSNYWGVHSGTGSLRGGGVTHIYSNRRPGAKELAGRVERRIGLLLILCLATNATILLIYTVTHFAALRAGLHDYMDDLRDGIYQYENGTLAVGMLPVPLALTADDPKALIPDEELNDVLSSTTEEPSDASAIVVVDTATTPVDEEVKEKEAPDFVTITPLEENNVEEASTMRTTDAKNAKEKYTVTTVMLMDMSTSETNADASVGATINAETDGTSTVSSEVDTLATKLDFAATSDGSTIAGIGGDLNGDPSSTISPIPTSAEEDAVFSTSTVSPPGDALGETDANDFQSESELPLTVAEVNRYDAVLESTLHTLALFAALNVLFLVIAVPLTYAYYYPGLIAAARRKPSEHAFVTNANNADEMATTANNTMAMTDDCAEAEHRVKSFRTAYKIFIVSVLVFSVIELFYFIDPLLHYATLLPHAVDRLLSVVRRTWSADAMNALEGRFVCTTAGRQHNTAPPDGAAPRAERREWLSRFAYMLQDECAPKLKDHFVRPYAVVILILCALAPLLFIVFTYAWSACVKDWRIIRTARQRVNAWSQRSVPK